MAVTADVTLAGGWEVGYTSTADGTNVIVTPQGKGINWAVRNDTTPPAESLKGHKMDSPWDRQFIVPDGETLFFRGAAGAVVSVTVT